MKKYYEAHELAFTLILIAIYSVGQSFATSLNQMLGLNYSANAVFNVALSVFLLVFIFKSELNEKIGFCKPKLPASRFLWFIPLVIISTNNFWNGTNTNLLGGELACYITYMFCVGIVEEVLFRGLLFRALEKDSLKTAMIVSSVTFGLGHIINLFNGVSTDVVVTLCQIVGAVALGFLYVVIFYRGGSLIPCIISHSAIDVLSVFANENTLTSEKRIVFTLIHCLIVVIYTLILQKTLNKKSAVAEKERL